MKLQRAKLTVALMTAGGFLAIGAIILFLFLPAWREVRRLKDDIVLAQTELEAQYANRKHLLSSRAKVIETKETMKTLATQFVPIGRELELITAIEALAARNGAKERLQITKNEGDKAAPEFEERFDLTIDGEYRSALQMLTDVEKLPTLMIFDSMSIRPGGGSSGPSTVQISLRGSIAVPPRGL